VVLLTVKSQVTLGSRVVLWKGQGGAVYGAEKVCILIVGSCAGDI
jgi:hypothetical protein